MKIIKKNCKDNQCHRQGSIKASSKHKSTVLTPEPTCSIRYTTGYTKSVMSARVGLNVTQKHNTYKKDLVVTKPV
jgi:hypothetical protein